MRFLIGAVFIIALAVLLLKGFDRIAGRGPKQIEDGINKSNMGENMEKRKPCPHCSERILLSAKKCPFCQSDLS